MRIINTLRNTIFAIAAQITTQILNFINRTIFIYYLGVEYLGVSGLFSNILSILSLAELGVGSAIVYSMYKPLADNDQIRIKQLVGFYANAYKVIGVVILSLGLILVPFLNNIVNNDSEIKNISIIYLIYLLNSVSTYFWAHKRSLIIADQKEYINSFNLQIFSIAQVVIDFFVLVLTQNFILYIFTKIIVNFISNLRISMIANKLYPFIKEPVLMGLPSDEKRTIFRNIRAMMYHKIGSVLVYSTDNILISIYFGVVYVGLYSNYSLITLTLITIASLLFKASTASVGNLNATENIEHTYPIFRRMFFLNFVIYTVVTVSLFNLIDDFIILWVGREFLLNKSIVLVIIINFFLMQMRTTTVLFKDTMGLFYQDRYRPLITASVNIISSLVLLNIFGLIGVFLGTLFCIVSITIWYEPLILYKYGFRKPLMEYFLQYTKYLSTASLCTVSTYYITHQLESVSWVIWFLKAIISVAGSILIIVFIFRKTEEYKYFSGLMRKFAKTNSKKFFIQIFES